MPDKTASRGSKHPLLAATAYLLVPGDRRRKAKGHFRKAGFEALKGVGTLVKPVVPNQSPEDSKSGKRQSISID